MPLEHYTRRWFSQSLLSGSLLAGPLLTVPILGAAARADSNGTRRVAITDFGALATAATVNTKAIQAAIDHVAAQGSGTVTVPPGVFVSGALFLKPKVNLHLDKGAVLRCSTEVDADFPRQRTRIEGHFEESFTPALINAKNCDGLRISGEGTLDGAGRPVWDRFWKLRGEAPDPRNFANIGLPRARLALIESSKGVTVEGVTFKDSQFWNLHLYNCEDVVVRHARFVVPDDYRQAPSTDGIDLDSCRSVTIEGCFFSVTDDCIAAKGSKGPRALEDKDSPPVEHVRVRDCVFKRGNAIMTLGSEATIVRDVIVENCRIIGPVKVAVLKLRPDTPQHYENIHYRNIDVAGANGPLLTIQPWTQYFALKGEAPPKSVVRDISFVGIRGRSASFGTIRPNPGQTEISDILLEDFDVQLTQDQLVTSDVRNLRFENVVVNGRPVAG